MPQRNGHADAIRRQMARIRDALDGDVEGVAREARTLSSWHYYLRRYPLLSMAAAFAVGYLIVPARVEIRAPDEKTLTKLARKRKLVIQPRSDQEPPRGLLSGAFNFLFGLAVNGVLTWAGQYLAGLLDREHAGSQPSAGEAGARAGSAGRSA